MRINLTAPSHLVNCGVVPRMRSFLLQAESFALLSGIIIRRHQEMFSSGRSNRKISSLRGSS